MDPILNSNIYPLAIIFLVFLVTAIANTKAMIIRAITITTQRKIKKTTRILFISVTLSVLLSLLLWQIQTVFTFYMFFEQRSTK
jgi:ABC-type cobalamin transport system permease subunit